MFFGPPNITLWLDYLSTIFGISNLFFLFSNQGYFYNIFDNPLAHSWSLGVEEQFYLLYPLILFLIITVLKKTLTHVIFFLSAIVCSSIFFSFYYFKINPDISFYLSPLRFWELGVGCVFYLLSDKIKKNLLISYLSIFGIIGLILLKPNLHYLIYNLIIVLLSITFITTYKKEYLIDNKVLQFLGKISYSFYLWHLPVIFFISIYNESFYYQVILSFIITVLLSTFSYYFIEKVFISKNKININFFKFISYSLSALMVFVIYAKYFNTELRVSLRNYIYKNNFLEKKYNWKERLDFHSIFIGNKEVHEYCSLDKISKSKNILNKNCLKENNNEYLVFVEGNSHTAQFLNPLNESEIIKNLYFSSVNNFQISKDLIKKISNDYKKVYYLTDINNLKKLDTLIESKLLDIDNVNFIFFNSTPFTKKSINVTRCLSRQINCKIIKSEDFKARNLSELNNKLKKFKNTSNKIYIFDSYNTLCPLDKCKVYDKYNDIIFYMDNTHLSLEGARYIKLDIEQFFKNEVKINNKNRT